MYDMSYTCTAFFMIGGAMRLEGQQCAATFRRLWPVRVQGSIDWCYTDRVFRNIDLISVGGSGRLSRAIGERSSPAAAPPNYPLTTIIPIAATSGHQAWRRRWCSHRVRNGVGTAAA